LMSSFHCGLKFSRVMTDRWLVPSDRRGAPDCELESMPVLKIEALTLFIRFVVTLRLVREIAELALVCGGGDIDVES
jgi:hypothetical protein